MTSLEQLVRAHLVRSEDPGTAAMIRRLRDASRRGYLTKSELEAACRWKSPRSAPLVRANGTRAIRRATALAMGTTDEMARIQALLALKGVSVPTASAVLTLLDPRRYGVLDIRVWQLLHGVGAVDTNPRGTGFTPAQWVQFLTVVRDLSGRLGLWVRTVERSLFAAHASHHDGLLYGRAESRT